MDVFSMPAAGLSSDEAINGFYGPAVQPSAVASSPGGGGGVGPVSRTTVPQWPAILLWWFILLGLLVVGHVLLLQAPT